MTARLTYSIVSTLTAITAAAGLCLAGGEATAATRNTLTAGQEIVLESGGTCSIGFFATNADHDLLAVTAGHCVEGVGEEVRTMRGDELGEVVAWEPDGGSANGSIDNDDPRGYTVIAVEGNWRHRPAFDAVADPHVGDTIYKSGRTSGDTVGTVTALINADAAPQYRLIDAELVVLPGDSGGPWYVENADGDLVLAGISSSSSFQSTTPDRASAQAQPIEGLYELITASDSEWTDGFQILVR